MGQLKKLKNLKSELKQPAGQLKHWNKSQKPTKKTWNNPKSQLKDLRKIQKKSETPLTTKEWIFVRKV